MCSKKVAGIALLVTGFILVIIGVIIGLVLPNTAHKKLEESTCVNSKDSSGYERWEGPSDFTTRLYYWNITNKQGFLYRGEKPQLHQKGPYVYSIKSKKVAVKFEKGKVTSKSFDQAKFNKTLTDKECPTCREDDKLTVLNTGYLVKGQDLSKALIPLVMNIIFGGLKLKGLNDSDILVQMGQTDNQLGLGSASNLAFGSWISSHPLFSNSLRKNYTVVEMNGLYGALLNTTKFGPFTNSMLLEKCMGGSLNIQCGLALNLLFLSKRNELAVSVSKLLCPSPQMACFNTSNPHTFNAVGAFIAEISKYVLSFLEENNYGATTTRNQNEMAKGYLLRLAAHPTGITIPGIVTSHANEAEAEKGLSSTFYTCESTADRFTYAAVGGESAVSNKTYPNASPEQLKIRGYYIQFPGVKSLKACSTKYTPTAKSYEIFITQFLFAIPVKYKEDVEIHDIPMHKYLLDESAVQVNNVTVFTKGIFDVTRVLRGPIYASLHGFLYGEPSLYKDLGLDTPDAQKYESLLSIEPISGTAMQVKLRIQLNGKIPSSLLAPETNVSFVDKMIPISWSETEATIDADTAKAYSSKVFGGLRLSCGLLVAFPVIGGILVIVGVVFIVLAVKKPDSVTVA